MSLNQVDEISDQEQVELNPDYELSQENEMYPLISDDEQSIICPNVMLGSNDDVIPMANYSHIGLRKLLCQFNIANNSADSNLTVDQNVNAILDLFRTNNNPIGAEKTNGEQNSNSPKEHCSNVVRLKDSDDDGQEINNNDDNDDDDGNETADSNDLVMEGPNSSVIERSGSLLVDQNQSDTGNNYFAESDYAEPITVTQYKCKFCSRKFVSVEKIRSHYISKHSSSSANNNCDDNNSLPTDLSARRRVTKRMCHDRKVMIDDDQSECEDESVSDEDKSINNKKSKRSNSKGKSARTKQNCNEVEVVRRFACDWPNCSYIARHAVHLKDHRRTHTGEKPFHCSWTDCNSSFIQSSALKTHMRTHTGEKPFRCEWPGCSMQFSQKNNVTVHMRTHTGERPYVCHWPGCEWTFSAKGNLEDHKKIHSDQKAFVCDFPGCVRRYTQNSHLRKHKLIHLDDKPFACDWPDCAYKSTRQTDLTNHKITHTGIKNFTCPECKKSFGREHHLKRHIAQIHSL